MSNLLLPGDPNFDKPLVMGNAYQADPSKDLVEQILPPGVKRAALEKQRAENPGSFKYAASQVAFAPDPWYKQAQAAGVDNMMTQPMWFSPLHTPQNWQIASKRREVYQWNRFWYENEPKVAAAIDFYARFPMNGFKLECPDRKILSFFEHHVVKKLKLNERFKEISSEYYMLGDVFIHADVECPICGGTAVDPDTQEPCLHPDGRFKRIFVMNPDWIEVQRSPLTDDPLVVLIPDEELQQIVHKRQPKAIYDRIPEHLKPLIMAKAPIPLSNNTVSHLRHMPVPYGTYGTSIIRRLFTTLAYKTKIMTANWIVAERLILPVRVVKIGSDDRPASTTDIADIQNQLAQTANDPNLTIVTHHNFDYEWYGCHTTDTTNSHVITSRGRVHYSDLTKDDLIATWNAHTGKIEYQNYMRNIEFDYNKSNSSGKAYKVGFRMGKNGWDGVSTPNHRHYLSNGKIKRSDELEIGDEIVNASQWKWDGKVPSKLPYKDWDGFENLSLEEFCEFAGYFVTEGHVKHEKSRNLREEVQGQAFGISQNADSECYESIKGLMTKISSKMYIHSDDRRTISNHTFIVANAPLARVVEESFGSGSTQKHIPSWLLNLPEQYLRILADAMIAGDGDINGSRYRFSTVSGHLKDQIRDIMMKLGFSTYVRKEDQKIKNRSVMYRIYWSNTLRPKKFKINVLEEIDYEGKMWCLEMHNKNFFIEIDGHILLTGNTSGKVLQITGEMEHIDKELLDGLMLNQALLNGEAPGYMSAQVGVETLIRRIEAWRTTLSEWCQERIFKPVAEMQGFVDEEKSEEVGETVFLYPTIKWNDLELKDDTQYLQMLMQLHDKQVISSQTLLEEMGLNYDQEVKRMRYEQAQLGPGGAALGQQGGMGGMGMGGMGEGGMGGMPGGAASPEQGGMGMPGMGMGPAGGGMDMGGGMGGGGGGGGMGMAAGAGGKITKKGKGGGQEEEEAIPMMPIKLTKIEQDMAVMLEELANNMGFNSSEFKMQFPVENPKGGKSFTMDFALPSLKIDIEADGEVWHSSEEQENSDTERDYLLAQRGWTILRFDDKSIEDSPQQVQATIDSYIRKSMDVGSAKQASQNGNNTHNNPIYFVGIDGRLKDFKNDGAKYYKYLDRVYPSRIRKLVSREFD